MSKLLKFALLLKIWLVRRLLVRGLGHILEELFESLLACRSELDYRFCPWLLHLGFLLNLTDLIILGHHIVEFDICILRYSLKLLI